MLFPRWRRELSILRHFCPPCAFDLWTNDVSWLATVCYNLRVWADCVRCVGVWAEYFASEIKCCQHNVVSGPMLVLFWFSICCMHHGRILILCSSTTSFPDPLPGPSAKGYLIPHRGIHTIVVYTLNTPAICYQNWIEVLAHSICNTAHTTTTPNLQQHVHLFIVVVTAPSMRAEPYIFSSEERKVVTSRSTMWKRTWKHEFHMKHTGRIGSEKTSMETETISLFYPT